MTISHIFDSVDLTEAQKQKIDEAFEAAVLVKVDEEKTKLEQEAEDFKTQIQETLQESLAGLTRREALREALKGMRVNISITFEEA